MTKKSITFVLTIIIIFVFAGCASRKSYKLFSENQELKDSPGWVTQLDAVKDAEQLIVVAGYDKNTAYVSMHEKTNGKWIEIISTPGFIGLDGLGEANINQALTPIGTFTVGKAFGIADNPGCKVEYTKVDETYYWSGDIKNHFNRLVSIKEVPDLDTENSEHIIDYKFQYQYVLDLGYNSECLEQNGYAFFLHCFGDKKPYTGGCVSVPEHIMRFIMQNIKSGCKITIDTMQNLGANFGD